MAPPSSVSDFTAFYGFDPASDQKCIFYIPDQASTCRLPRSEADTARACEIYSEIVNGSGSPDVALLEEYVKRNLCSKPMRFFKGHRKDVQDTQPSLVKDLAARWLREIRVAKGQDTIESDDVAREDAPPQTPRIASTPASASRSKTQTPRSKIPTPSAIVDPTVLKFVPFHDIDPINQGTCIYMTKQDKRCTWACVDEDNEAACLLYKQFGLTDDIPEIALLMEFAKYNCCRSGSLGAGHRSRLEYGRLPKLLAERWLGEIRQRRQRTTTPTPSRKTKVARESVGSVRDSNGKDANIEISNVQSPSIAGSEQDSHEPVQEMSSNSDRTKSSQVESPSPVPDSAAPASATAETPPAEVETAPAEADLAPAAAVSVASPAESAPAETESAPAATEVAATDAESGAMHKLTGLDSALATAPNQEAWAGPADHQSSVPSTELALDILSDSGDRQNSAPSKPPKPARLRGKSIVEISDAAALGPAELDDNEETPAQAFIAEEAPLAHPTLNKKSKPVVPPKSRLLASLPHSPPLSPERSPVRGD